MRIKISSLLPETKYAVEIRAASDNGKSEWGPRFEFITTGDTDEPAVPANVTWEVAGSSFFAQWDSVVKTKTGRYSAVTRYEVEIRKDTIRRIISVPQQTGSRVGYMLTLAENKRFFADPEGNPAKALYMRVRAVDNKDLKSDWSEEYYVDASAPGKVVNLTAEGTTDAIEIKWEPPLTGDDGELTYKVFASTDPNFYNPKSFVYHGSATFFTFGTGTYEQHTIRVAAINALGAMGEFSIVTAEPVSPYGVDVDPPQIPVNLAATIDTAAKKITASWVYPDTSDEDLYMFAIRWRVVGDTHWGMEWASRDDSTVTWEVANPFAPFEIQISTLDKFGNYSEWSSPINVTGGDTTPPPAVTGVVVATGLDSLSIRWDESTASDVAAGAGVYEVEVDDDADFSSVINRVRTGNTQISINGLPRETTYYVRVRAVDASKLEGPWSETVQATTAAFPPPPEPSDGNAPPAVASAPVLRGGLGFFAVRFEPVQNFDAVTYEVHLSTSAGFTPTESTKVAETMGNSAVIIRSDSASGALQYDTDYFAKIVARDLDGPAEPSPVSAPSRLSRTSADDIEAGTFTRGNFMIGEGGIILSSQYASSGGSQGFALTDDNFIIKTGSVEVGTLASNGTITATGLGLTGNMTISSGGYIESSGYSTSNTGFRLSASGLDVKSGTIAAGAISSGTYSGKTFTVGVGGEIVVDSTGVIRSNNWDTTNGTGWRLSSAGLTMYGGSFNGGNINGTNITGSSLGITGGGSVYGSQWTLNNTGLYFNAGGIISGGTVIASQMYSSSTDPVTGFRYFELNSGGYATLSGVNLRGNMNVPSGTANFIQTSGFSPGGSTTGWKISGDGTAAFNNLTVYRNTTTGSGSSHNIQSGTYNGSSTGWLLRGDGHAWFYGNLTANNFSGNGTFTANDSSSGWSASLSGSRLNFSTNMWASGYIGTITSWAGTSLLIRPPYAGPSSFAGIVMNGGASEYSVLQGYWYHQGAASGANAHSVVDTPLKLDSHLRSPATVGLTSGSASNVRINIDSSSAVFAMTGSSRDIKVSIEDIDRSQIDSLLGLNVRTWFDKHSAEALAEYHETGDDECLSTAESLRRIPGLVAEEVEDAGATRFVEYDANGKPIGLMYDRIGVVWIPLVRELREENRDLKDRVSRLEKMVEALIANFDK